MIGDVAARVMDIARSAAQAPVEPASMAEQLWLPFRLLAMVRARRASARRRNRPPLHRSGTDRRTWRNAVPAGVRGRRSRGQLAVYGVLVSEGLQQRPLPPPLPRPASPTRAHRYCRSIMRFLAWVFTVPGLLALALAAGVAVGRFACHSITFPGTLAALVDALERDFAKEVEDDLLTTVAALVEAVRMVDCRQPMRLARLSPRGLARALRAGEDHMAGTVAALQDALAFQAGDAGLPPRSRALALRLADVRASWEAFAAAAAPLAAAGPGEAAGDGLVRTAQAAFGTSPSALRDIAAGRPAPGRDTRVAPDRAASPSVAAKAESPRGREGGDDCESGTSPLLRPGSPARPWPLAGSNQSPESGGRARAGPTRAGARASPAASDLRAAMTAAAYQRTPRDVLGLAEVALAARELRWVECERGERARALAGPGDEALAAATGMAVDGSAPPRRGAPWHPAPGSGLSEGAVALLSLAAAVHALAAALPLLHKDPCGDSARGGVATAVRTGLRAVRAVFCGRPPSAGAASLDLMRGLLAGRFGGRQVWVCADDGTRLDAMLVPAAPAEGGRGTAGRRLVVLANPNAGLYEYHHRHSALTELHRDCGSDVLLFNYRGYGRSGGSPSPAKLRTDAAAIVRFARRECGAALVAVHSESIGGLASTHLAARGRDRGAAVDLLIADRAFSDVHVAARHLVGRWAEVAVRGLMWWSADNVRSFLRADCPKIATCDARDQIVVDAASLKAGVADHAYTRRLHRVVALAADVAACPGVHGQRSIARAAAVLSGRGGQGGGPTRPSPAPAPSPPRAAASSSHAAPQRASAVSLALLHGWAHSGAAGQGALPESTGSGSGGADAWPAESTGPSAPASHVAAEALAHVRRAMRAVAGGDALSAWQECGRAVACPLRLGLCRCGGQGDRGPGADAGAAGAPPAATCGLGPYWTVSAPSMAALRASLFRVAATLDQCADASAEAATARKRATASLLAGDARGGAAEAPAETHPARRQRQRRHSRGIVGAAVRRGPAMGGDGGSPTGALSASRTASLAHASAPARSASPPLHPLRGAVHSVGRGGGTLGRAADGSSPPLSPRDRSPGGPALCTLSERVTRAADSVRCASPRRRAALLATLRRVARLLRIVLLSENRCGALFAGTMGTQTKRESAQASAEAQVEALTRYFRCYVVWGHVSLDARPTHARLVLPGARGPEPTQRGDGATTNSDEEEEGNGEDGGEDREGGVPTLSPFAAAVCATDPSRPGWLPEGQEAPSSPHSPAGTAPASLLAWPRRAPVPGSEVTPVPMPTVFQAVWEFLCEHASPEAVRRVQVETNRVPGSTTSSPHPASPRPPASPADPPAATTAPSASTGRGNAPPGTAATRGSTAGAEGTAAGRHPRNRRMGSSGSISGVDASQWLSPGAHSGSDTGSDDDDDYDGCDASGSSAGAAAASASGVPHLPLVRDGRTLQRSLSSEAEVTVPHMAPHSSPDAVVGTEVSTGTPLLVPGGAHARVAHSDGGLSPGEGDRGEGGASKQKGEGAPHGQFTALPEASGGGRRGGSDDEEEEGGEEEEEGRGRQSRSQPFRGFCGGGPSSSPASSPPTWRRTAWPGGGMPAIDVVTAVVESARQGLRAALPDDGLANDVCALCEALLRVEAQHVAFRRLLGTGHHGDGCCSTAPRPLPPAMLHRREWQQLAGAYGAAGTEPRRPGEARRDGNAGATRQAPTVERPLHVPMAAPGVGAPIHVGCLLPLNCGHNGKYLDHEREALVQELARLGWRG